MKLYWQRNCLMLKAIERIAQRIERRMKMGDNRVQLNDEALENVVGGVLIKRKTVTNKDTGEVYKLKVDPMTAFAYATANGNKSDSEIIAGMLAAGLIE